MGCMYSINRADKRRQPKLPKLRAIADDCQQHTLPGMQQCLASDHLDICVRNIHLVLAAAQAMIDIYDQIKNPDKYYRLSGNAPFRCLDMKDLHAWVENLKQVMEELQKRRREIEESLRSIKRKRKACNAVFTVVTIGVIVGSVVLAALVAVPVAAISGTAAGGLVKTVEQWISSVWEQRKGELDEEHKLVEKMQSALQVLASYDHLVSLTSLMQKVKIDYAVMVVDMEHFRLKFILKDIGAGAGDDDEAIAENKMKDMKTKINELKACMDLLISTVDKCTKKIRRAELELSLTINN